MPRFPTSHSSIGAHALSESDGMRIQIHLTLVFLLLISGSTAVFAEEPGSSVSKRMMFLIEKLDKLEKEQKSILATEDNILEEIKGLKIQARH